MEISVVIAARGRRELLRRCLLTLSRQTIPTSVFEILVGAYGAEGEYEDLLSELPVDNVRFFYVENRKNLNICPRARNVCIRRADSDLVAFVDADMLVGPEYLERVLRHHATNDKIIVHGARYNLRESAMSRLENLDVTREFEEVRHLPMDEYGVLGAGGNNSVRREHVVAIRGQDEDFTGYAYEDPDLNERLELAGLKPVFTSDVCVYHQYHANPYHGALTRWGRKRVLGPNKKLYKERRGVILRNLDREWGSLEDTN